MYFRTLPRERLSQSLALITRIHCATAGSSAIAQSSCFAPQHCHTVMMESRSQSTDSQCFYWPHLYVRAQVSVIPFGVVVFVLFCGNSTYLCRFAVLVLLLWLSVRTTLSDVNAHISPHYSLFPQSTQSVPFDGRDVIRLYTCSPPIFGLITQFTLHLAGVCFMCQLLWNCFLSSCLLMVLGILPGTYLPNFTVDSPPKVPSSAKTPVKAATITGRAVVDKLCR